MQSINESKSWFFENKNVINRLLAQLTERKNPSSQNQK